MLIAAFLLIMAIIKEIIQNPKIKDCVTVTTDENSFVLNKEVCLNERLYAGKVISGGDIKRILSASENKCALNKALSYISRKKCSCKMMCDYLKGKGFGGDACKAAADKLKEYGYLSDEDFASSFVNYSGGGKGRLKIAYELKAKGISEDIIKKYNKDGDSDLSDCIRTAEKFLKNKDSGDIKTKQKLYRHLLYRGYEYETVQSAVSAVTGGEIET